MRTKQITIEPSLDKIVTYQDDDCIITYTYKPNKFNKGPFQVDIKYKYSFTAKKQKSKPLKTINDFIDDVAPTKFKKSKK